MSNTTYTIQSDTLTGLANAIREITGSQSQLSPQDMINAVEGHTCPEPVIQSLSVTENGTYTAPEGVDGYSPVSVSVSGGGGGGASNLIKGTFNYDSKGSKTIDVPYTGNGFPVGVMIFPTGGSKNAAMTALTQKGALLFWAAIKVNNNTPTYEDSNDDDGMDIFIKFKSSNTGSTATNLNSATGTHVFTQSTPTSTGYASSVKFHSKTSMEIYVSNTNSNTAVYGFPPNIDYTYYIIYSS